MPIFGISRSLPLVISASLKHIVDCPFYIVGIYLVPFTMYIVSRTFTMYNVLCTMYIGCSELEAIV